MVRGHKDVARGGERGGEQLSVTDSDPTAAPVWNRFWQDRALDDIYPAVGDIEGELFRLLGDVEGLRILEVGAGTGRTAAALSAAGAQVTLLDISPEALRLCGEAAPGATRVLGNALSAPFPEESFDVIYHQGLLEHFREPRLLLEANQRLLRPGGLLLVDVPQRWHVYTVMKHILMAVGKWFAGWERSFSPRELQGLMERSGVEVVHTYGYFMRPSLAYRTIRQMAGAVGFHMPREGRGMHNPLMSNLLERIERSRLGPWLTLTVGVAGRKKV